MAVRLVVVGGGLAGLSAAYAAEQAAREAGLDLRVALLEASTRLGGKVQTARSDRFVLEGGPDAVVRYKPWALELMRELGLRGTERGGPLADRAAVAHPSRLAARQTTGGTGPLDAPWP